MSRAIRPLAGGVLWWAALCLSMKVSAQTPVAAAEPDALDRLSALPFEQLLQTQVETTSRIARQLSDALSAVTIVTSAEIKAYGYRSLAEIVNSMRGQYTTYDRLYQYMGGRGFGVPGDFAGRSLLLIDGYAAPDNVYNQNYIDNSGLIDVDLIERVEYVPGSGSVIYGNNALLSIINVVTKKGAAFERGELALEAGSYGHARAQAIWGASLDDGGDVLLAVSRQRSEGQTIYMPGFDSPDTNNGLAVDQDFESSVRGFGKLAWRGVRIEAAAVSRTKGRPTSTDGWILYDFNQEQSSTDKNAFLSAHWEQSLGEGLHGNTHFYAGNYHFNGHGYVSGNYTRDVETGAWWGIDQKLHWRAWKNHTPVLGVEFRSDRQRSKIDLIEDQSASKETLSLYAQDVYSFAPDWQAYGGIRLDQVLKGEAVWSPRVGLIHQWTPKLIAKTSAGLAHRQPTYFEKFSQATFKQPNLNLRPEKVQSLDWLVQYDWSRTSKVAATVYRYDMRERIAFSPEASQYVNVGPSQSQGLEMELDHRGADGRYLKLSAAFQRARDAAGEELLNSPNAVLKLNFSHLLAAAPVRMGYELQYLGPRLSLDERTLGGFSIANLTMNLARKWAGFSLSVGVKNLLDRPIDAASPVLWTGADGTVQDTLRMDGRNYWLRVSYDLGW